MKKHNAGKQSIIKKIMYVSGRAMTYLQYRLSNFIDYWIKDKLGFITKGSKKDPLFKTKIIEWKTSTISYFRDVSEERRFEFRHNGYNKKRPFFPHKIYYLLKAGPDALKLANRMCGENDPNKIWEVVLFATRPQIDEFPVELFFDNELIWHQQQLGKIGHIAFACLVVKGSNVYGLNYISDIVQRQSKRMDYKNRINKFKAWHHLLLNSILNFALENNINKVFSPTSDLVMKNTDLARSIQKELFERVYDRSICKRFQAKKQGEWWVIDVTENRNKIIIPEKSQEHIKRGKTICLCHDIERGLGHIDTDQKFAESANRTSSGYLKKILKIEKEMNVRATYNVLGCFLNQVREEIEMGGHCIAFHSYDHNMSRNQLKKCRRIDYRIRGYRPARSKITSELTDNNLCYHNFDWLASSTYSLRTKLPRMKNRIVKIPILFDDFELHKSRTKYERWEQNALEKIKQNDFVAFCLHDCYAQYWLPHYKEFLRKINGLGKLRTLDEVANDVILGSCSV